MSAIKASNLADAIISELSKYSSEVMEIVKDNIHEIAEEGAEKLRETSPKGDNKQKYAKGWKASVEYESDHDVRMRIKNTTEPSLTHLLEHGHATANGGRTTAQPHIQPVDEEVAEKLEKRVYNAL